MRTEREKRGMRKRQGGCDFQVAKSSSVWHACFIHQGAAEGEDQPGTDGFVPAVGQEREGQMGGNRKKRRIRQTSL